MTGQHKSAPAFDEAEIRAAERRLVEALQAPDPAAWVYAYTEDAIFVAPGAPAVQGRAALLQMAKAMKPLSSVSIRPIRTEGDANLATVVAQGSWVSGKPPEAGSVANVRLIIVWRKEADGQWRIAQELLHADPAFAAAPAAATAAESEVKAFVERFLDAAGDQRFDELATMFAPGASIGSASLRNGTWVTATRSAADWLAALRSNPGRKYTEPVGRYTVHVDDDRLAFVRAEATVMRDGQARSRNADYFTLVRGADGKWKFISASYTAQPVAQ